jgi:hypothetical protein
MFLSLAQSKRDLEKIYPGLSFRCCLEPGVVSPFQLVGFTLLCPPRSLLGFFAPPGPSLHTIF